MTKDIFESVLRMPWSSKYSAMWRDAVCPGERAEVLMRALESATGVDWDNHERENVCLMLLAAFQDEARITKEPKP